jgi:hypothetical protein
MASEKLKVKKWTAEMIPRVEERWTAGAIPRVEERLMVDKKL